MEQEKKNTKSSKSLLYSLLIITCFIVLIALIVYFGTKINSKIENIVNDIDDVPVFEENESNNESNDTQPLDVYCLKEYNNKIGIYKNDALIYTIDRFIFTLPDNDKKLLKEGIYTTDTEEFYKILEQYY